MIMEQGQWSPFVNRIFQWEVAIATFLSVLGVVPRHCARLTCFLHPKLRDRNAVLMRSFLRLPYGARGVQVAFFKGRTTCGGSAAAWHADGADVGAISGAGASLVPVK